MTIPPAGRPADVGHADVRHADPTVARLLADYFGAKSARDVEATHAFFHPDRTQYFDATLGWQYRDNAAVRAVWEQFMPRWPATARSYATTVWGDRTGAVVALTDSPEMFGSEIRALAVVDLDDHGGQARIVRWVDYWDARAFGAEAAAAMRTPPADYPHDLGVTTVRSSADPAITRAVETLGAALTGGPSPFAVDAVFEDRTLRATVRGGDAITRFLRRAADLLPYAGADVTHVVGGARGGGYEWTAPDGPVARGVLAVGLDEDGAIASATAMWDGALVEDAWLHAALVHVPGP